jgi:hypothetical protein
MRQGSPLLELESIRRQEWTKSANSPQKRHRGRDSLTFEEGASDEIRTRDLMITNQLLYQLSYAGGWRRGNYADGCTRQARVAANSPDHVARALFGDWVPAPAPCALSLKTAMGSTATTRRTRRTRRIQAQAGKSFLHPVHPNGELDGASVSAHFSTVASVTPSR